ncbi:M6 family metalloprotease domain-containing protein [Streptomyces microflavus]|uniref:M6 family metalloprotease domain-containing protein n=1 Tax=Streptomyces microflavus TaxID=1919 RepID=A0A6N9VNJ1_STRMI|nr:MULTISPECIES: M6 family metalloprotease domain-containing protein [Streptomyces]MBK3587115.1 M6 family metalloprotease domain-containing protein [Streptomyces sp. MBT57]MBK5996442.1 M6 family metalloprotease domain-containing protein [Streptomyces sp. MBT58]MBW3358620.1 M6 family metalloprotease domain-containing protein [Streptomyces sp. 09ZI22]MEE1731769.1 M6 family metalloprotease domain-containing protein [Streptomyces sp. BE282]NEB71621.1 M6 family metalloprotease domain-containing pro
MQREPGPGGAERLKLRSLAAALTSLLALAATSLVAGPAAAAARDAAPCALPRTAAHHSLGLDSWNGAYPQPGRRLDAVMIFLSFPDSEPVLTPELLTADHFPSTTRFFERASYGRFTLRPHPRRTWTQMPRPSTWYGIERDWDAKKRTAYLRDAIAAADEDVDFSAYDIVYLVADPDAPGVDSDATKVVNFERPLRADSTDIRRVVTVFEQHPPDRNVLAHETGHVFDLADLYHRPTDGKGDWDTYVGDWDVMGSQFGLAPDLFGWHKWKLGWLEGAQVVCVQGSADLTLEPVAAAPVPGGSIGTRLAVVRTGADSVLAVEARSATGNDRGTCTEGILIYRVRSGTASGGGPVEVVDTHPETGSCWDRSVYPPLADAPLTEGETYTVPGERTRVEVAGRTPSGSWTVRITAGV